MFLGEDLRKDKWEKRSFISLKIEHEGYYIQINNVELTNLEPLWDVYFWEVKMLFKFWYINLLYFRAKKNVEASQKKPNTENNARTPTKTMAPMIYDEPRRLLVSVFLLNDVSWNLPYSLHPWISDHEKLIRNLKKTRENALIWNSIRIIG